MSKQAIIIGAGIGGLTTALSLKQFGWDVKILEAAPELSEIGAGIQLSPNAMKVLRALSPQLAEDVSRAGRAPKRLALYDALTGFQLFSVAVTQRWHAPYINIYRPELIALLIKALDGIELELGQKVDVDQLERLKRASDLVVVSSGVHSELVREHFFAEPPTASGHVAYRCVLPSTQCQDLGIPDASRVLATKNRHAVTYEIKHGEEGRLVNFVGIVEADPTYIESLSKGWDAQDARTQALKSFSNFTKGIPELLQRATSVQPWPLFYRKPLSAWHNRNAVLLGDAAHAMLPTFAQGAAMAIEDAWVLAAELAGGHTINNALSRYTGRRLHRVQAVQRQALRNLDLFHRKGLFNLVIGTMLPMAAGTFAPHLILKRFDAVYGDDVTNGLGKTP